jgi:signal transduction histidine kinase
MPQTDLSPRTDALDVFVELLSGLDDRALSGRAFYDRLCEAVCRLTSMERAGLFLYDDVRKIVVPVGSHGVEPDLLADVYGTLEETPVAQRALGDDRVVEVSEHLEREVPPRYARFAGVTTLTCTPVSAGGRWLGVIFADRGGGHFTLTEPERHTMWTLGKTAALAASARIATSQQGRARLLSARIALAREIHERVVQRLFGISLVLGSDRELTDVERDRCAEEMQAALSDLREALARPLSPPPQPMGGSTLADELRRLGRHYRDLPLEVDWDPGLALPSGLDSLAQSVLAEALRNIDKHARPSQVRVRVGRTDGTFVLEIRNDGVGLEPDGARSTGMGLRLAGLEALQLGGVVEFGRENGEWRVRLVVPVREDGPA